MLLKLDENLGERGRIAALARGSIERKLWTVERHRIRVYLTEE